MLPKDTTMDLDLSELVEAAFTDGHPHRAMFDTFFEYAGKALDNISDDLDLLSVRLLWIASHYISVNELLKLQLGYVEMDAGGGRVFGPRLSDLANLMTTPVAINVIQLDRHRIGSQIHKSPSYREPGPGFSEHVHEIENPLGVMLVRYDNTIVAGCGDQLSVLIAANPFLSHIICLRPAGVVDVVSPILSSGGWNRISRTTSLIAIDIYRNTNWEARLALVPPYVERYAFRGNQKMLSPVDISRFGGVRWWILFHPKCWLDRKWVVTPLEKQVG